MLSQILKRRNHYVYSRIDNSGILKSIDEEGVSDEGSDSTEPAANTTFSPDDAIGHIGFGKFQINLFLTLGLVWMVEGMEIFVLSVLAPYLRCQWNLTYFEESLLPMLTSLGMMLSAPVWGWVCDVYGRKNGLYISSLWFMYFAVLSVFSPNYTWLLILRFLVGAGIGSVPQAMTILAEYSPRKTRGKTLTSLFLFWSIGFVFASVLSLWTMVDFGFRALLAALCVPGLVFLLTFWWMPESFRFYVATGQTARALELLQHIATANGTSLPAGTLKLPEPTAKGTSKLTELFRGGLGRVTLTLWLISFITIMMYYASVYITPEIFQRYDANTCTDRVGSEVLTCRRCALLTRRDYADIIWTCVGEFLGVFIATFLVDTLGRKPSLCLVSFVSVLLQSLFFFCLTRNGATLLLFVVRCAMIASAAITLVYTVEVYPTPVRATAMGYSFLFARVGMFVAPIIAEALFHWDITTAKYVLDFALIVEFLAALWLPFDTSDRELV